MGIVAKVDQLGGLVVDAVDVCADVGVVGGADEARDVDADAV